jgi:hypothetical protein
VFACLSAVGILVYCTQVLLLLQGRSPEIGVGMALALVVLIFLAFVMVIWMRWDVRPGEYRPPLGVHVLAAVGVLGLALLAASIFFLVICALQM